MKLRTQISGWPGDVMIVYDADCGLSVAEQAEHDMLAAHALSQATKEALHIFHNHTRWHKAHAWINQRAAEILAGWMGEEGG